jgi:hypothetical protein
MTARGHLCVLATLFFAALGRHVASAQPTLRVARAFTPIVIDGDTTDTFFAADEIVSVGQARVALVYDSTSLIVAAQVTDSNVGYTAGASGLGLRQDDAIEIGIEHPADFFTILFSVSGNYVATDNSGGLYAGVNVTASAVAIQGLTTGWSVEAKIDWRSISDPSKPATDLFSGRLLKGEIASWERDALNQSTYIPWNPADTAVFNPADFGNFIFHNVLGASSDVSDFPALAYATKLLPGKTNGDGMQGGSVLAFDCNSDGLADIVRANTGGPNNQVFLDVNVGGGNFNTFLLYDATARGETPLSLFLAFGDLNNGTYAETLPQVLSSLTRSFAFPPAFQTATMTW